MAATKTHQGSINARTQDKIRASIKVFEIVKALQDHILAGLKMTNTQVRAAEILMRKCSPDLLATAISDARSDALPVLQIIRKGSVPTPISDAAQAISSPESATDTPHSKVS